MQRENNIMPDESSGGGSTIRRGLGRGLGALIVNTDPTRHAQEQTVSQAGAGGVQLIPVGNISPNPQQPRSSFDEDALAELAASIREHGVIQPLIVTEDPQQSGHYWLITGERRLRAAQIAQLTEVPSIVRDASPQQLLELALVENVQRADLNPLEEAAAYQMLIDRFALTQEEIAQRVGRSRSAVANTLRLLQLPADVQQALIAGVITAGHARALLALPDEAAMNDGLQRILARGLNVRQAEDLVKQMLHQDAEPGLTRQVSVPDPHVKYLENRFRAALGTRVSLSRNRDGTGRLIVHFYNDEDLESIYRIIAADEGDAEYEAEYEAEHDAEHEGKYEDQHRG
jgi:ParB family transcriptional regulator, chromosome partitioning protein